MSGEGHEPYPFEIRVGDAAELLVEADLLLQEIVPIRAVHKYPYDYLVPRDASFIRLQVKAVSEPRMEGPMPGAYQFSLRQGKAREAYSLEELDVFALVALDIRKIAYKTVEELKRPQGIVTTVNLKAEDFDKWAKWPFK